MPRRDARSDPTGRDREDAPGRREGDAGAQGPSDGREDSPRRARRGPRAARARLFTGPRRLRAARGRPPPRALGEGRSRLDRVRGRRARDDRPRRSGAGARGRARGGDALAPSREAGGAPGDGGRRLRERGAPSAGIEAAARGRVVKKRRPPPWARQKVIGARELALQLLAAIESRNAYSDRLLQSRLRDAALSPRDAALVTTPVQGTLRHPAL